MKLNEKEQLILKLYLEGKKKGEIAEAMSLTVDTITRNLKKIKDALSAGEVELTEKEQTVLEITLDENEHLKKELAKAGKEDKLTRKILNIFEDTMGRYTYVPREINRHNNAGKRKAICMSCADWHTGETVDAEEVLGMNKFNLAILEHRVMRYTYEVINRYDGHETVYIQMLGDMVTGIIHAELLQGCSSVDQVMAAVSIASRMLKELASVFPEVVVIGVVGNHGRMFQKPNFKQKYNNFDYLFYKMLEQAFSEWKNITFQIPKSAFVIQEVLGTNILVRHGDGKTANSLGIPLYAVNRSHNTIASTLTFNKGVHIDAHIIGHFHNSASFESSGGAMILMSGSIKGADEYSFLAMGVGGRPTQKMYEVVEGVGITWQYDFKCDDPSDMHL